MSGISNWYKNNHSDGLYSKKLYIESQSCHIARKEILFIRKECKDSEVFVKMLDNQQKKEGCTCWCKNTDENYSGDRVHVIC